jgi:hypothetical protein
MRKDLFTKIIISAMSDPPPRPNLRKLLSYPFTLVESDMFVEYLKSVEQENSFARDVLLTWNIQSARFPEAKDTLSGAIHLDERQRVTQQLLEKAKLCI